MEPQLRQSRRHRPVVGLASIAVFVSACFPVVAAEYMVDRTDDTAAATACTAAPNDCSLRGAILQANAHPGPDTIDLQAGAMYKLTLGPSDSGAGQIDATHGDLDVTDDLVINGNGATIDAAGLDRAIDIERASLTPFAVTLNNLKVTGGVTRGFLSVGGGINVRAATLNLVGCTVSGNSTVDGQSTDNGGGIAANGVQFPSAVLAHLNLTGTMVTGNTGGNGGGIACGSCSLMLNQSVVTGNSAVGSVGGGGVFATGTGSTIQIANGSSVSMNSSMSEGGGLSLFTGQVVITNGAIMNNQATGDGGGIFNDPTSPGTVNVTSSTLTGNQAAGGGVGLGGGIFNGGGAVSVQFSRIVANRAEVGAATGVQDAGGTADLRNDWWGCNTGPAGLPCDGVSGPGAAFIPWLTLRLAGAPAFVAAGQGLPFVGDLTRNSAGMDTSSSGHVADGTPATFSGTLGTVSPPSSGTFGGRATTQFTAGPSIGNGALMVTVDHQAALANFSIVLPGDLNGDGVVDARDLALMIGLILGNKAASPQEVAAGDTRPKPGANGRTFGDGRLDVDDLNWLFRRYLGLEVKP